MSVTGSFKSKKFYCYGGEKKGEFQLWPTSSLPVKGENGKLVVSKSLTQSRKDAQSVRNRCPVMYWIRQDRALFLVSHIAGKIGQVGIIPDLR
jgi:hypothetical protein